MRLYSPLLLLLASTAASAAAPPAVVLPITVERVALPAQALHAGKKTPLLPRRALNPGDTLLTGYSGRVSLMLDHAGQIALGEDSELYLHSAEAPGAGYGALARMALMRGSLRLDSTARADLQPQDMRLNIGTLRVRAKNAEVWAGIEPGQNQTLCLLQGSVEIMSDSGNDILDTPGDCFRYSSGNIRMRLRPDSDAVLARKLNRTAFADDKPSGKPPVTVAAPAVQTMPPPTPLEIPAAPPTPMAAVAEPPAVPAPEPAAPPHSETVTLTPEPAPVLAGAPPVEPPPPRPEAAAVVEEAPAPAAEPAAVAASSPPVPAATTAAAGYWTVVVHSIGSGLAADKEAKRLRSLGLDAEVWLTDKGSYRVSIGHFATREAAHQYSLKLRDTQKLQGWVAQSS